ncbi:hypothetical protein REPUB_Repub06bG0222100 [Reevesia pubescens]
MGTNEGSYYQIRFAMVLSWGLSYGILNDDEKDGGALRPTWKMHNFRLAIHDCDLQEIHVHGPLLTWCRKQDGRMVYERLDRPLVSRSWLDKLPETIEHHVIATSSDHIPVLAKIEGVVRTRFLIVGYQRACMDFRICQQYWPVRCKFHSTIAHVDRSVRRRALEEVIRSNNRVRSLLELRYVPETSVSTNNIVLQNQDTLILRITNKCDKDKAIFKIICEGQSTVKDDD